MSKRSIPLSALPDHVRARLNVGKREPVSKAAKRLREENAAFRRGLFFSMLASASLPLPEFEVRFDEKRLWKFDYAWRQQKVALEVDGGAFSGGRHTSGTGFRRDLEKMNAAVVQGWKVIRVLPEQLTNKATETALRRVLNVGG